MHASRRQVKARARPFSPQINSSSSSSMHQQAPPSPPAYKVAKLVRGQQGFGFTISGQAPCILSCVVPHSSADRAGLHAGDCLLAVNGCDVSRAPHDEVVRLVGSCMGTLRLHLAESGGPPTTTAVAANGYSSSDEESEIKLRVPSKLRPTRNSRHPNRGKRKGTTPPHRAERMVHRDFAAASSPRSMAAPLKQQQRLVQHHTTGTSKQRRRRNSSDDSNEHLANLMASPHLHARFTKQQNSNGQQLVGNGVGPAVVAPVSTSSSSSSSTASGQLMYRSVVGYLGTIEMPEESSSGSNQSSPSSGISGDVSASSSAAARLAAIKSCVRRLRIEKKVHTLVLLRVWGPRPGAAGAAISASTGKITLTSPAGANLARFPARRVVFCGAYADDARFFGLVTSAASTNASETTDDDQEEEDDNNNDESRGGGGAKMFKTASRKNPTGFTSCHVFMVDSRLVAHEGHAARAHAFRFQCTAADAALAAGDGQRVSSCLEFPPTAEPILQAVLSLCASSGHANGPNGNNSIGSGLMGWASPLLQQQQQRQQQQQQRLHNLSSHSSNSSSNSDSGIFRDRDDGKCSDRDIQLRHHQIIMEQQLLQVQQQQGGVVDRLTVRAMPGPSPSSIKSPGEIEHAARLRSSMQRYLNQQQQPQAMLLLNRNTGTHQHVNPSLSVRATMTLEEKLSPQVYKGGRPGGGGGGGLPHHQPTANRPIRTPSERSRARSLDDLSKSSQADEQQQQEEQEEEEDLHHHHHHRHHHPQLGSDNGLDKLMDWQAPYTSRPRLAPKSLRWGSQRPTSEAALAMSRQHDQDDDDHDDHNEVLHSTPPPPPPHIPEVCNDHHHIEEIINAVEKTDHQHATVKASQSTTTTTATTTTTQDIWTQGFEKLLEDPLGLRAFAEFLKKEFSHENIYFWVACERFHRLFPTDDAAIASTEAHKIFERHLGPTAAEPVNVDSQARQTAEENLSHPGPELFHQAQKQVFNLMKYDCYPRFLRSTIYRQCVEALQNQQTPPIGEATLHDVDLNIDNSTTADGEGDSTDRSLAALKKSGSDAGERRRRSLLPWPKKDRSKSKDRGELEYRKTNKKKHRIGSTSSATSAASADKEKDNVTDDEDHHQQQMKRAASRDSVASEFSDRAFRIQSSASSVPLVKVLLPDLSSAVIAARPGQSVQQLLNKLLERRGLRFNAFELYDQNTSTQIELERDASILAGLEIRLEPRVVFHLLLVSSGKSLMIRGQPRRQLGEVLKPILIKYGLKMDQSIIVKSASGDVVQPKTLLTSLDGLYLKVTDESQQQLNSTLEDPIGPPPQEPSEDQAPPKSSLLSRRGLTRRNSLQSERSRTVSAKKHSSTNSQTINESDGIHNFTGSSKRLSLHESATNLMPPPRAPPGPPGRKATSQRNPLSKLENEALYEHLKRAQRCRLEDQRGTEINFELPDFLKLPGYSQSCELPLDGRASEPIRGCRPRLVYQESYEFPLDGRVSEPIFSRRDASESRTANGSCASPDFAAIAAQILDRSFSSDGLMPTHEQAETYFASASNGSLDLKSSSQPMPSSSKITVAAAKQNVATVAARIAAIEQNDRIKKSDRQQQMAKSSSNSNWDDLLLDLDVDWRCYQGRETDDQKQQLQQHNRPKITTNVPVVCSSNSSSVQRPPLPTPPALELLDLDDPLIAASPQPALPPPLPPKPGKIKMSDAMKATNTQQPMPPPRPPSRNVNTRVNVSFV